MKEHMITAIVAENKIHSKVVFQNVRKVEIRKGCENRVSNMQINIRMQIFVLPHV